MYQNPSIFDDSFDSNEIHEYDEISSISHIDLNLNLFDYPAWMQNITFTNIEKSEIKKIVFTCELVNKPRGRPKQKETKKEKHSSSSHDNIISKIQIYFLNFVIFFLNDCINVYFKNYKNRILYFFKKFDYKYKSRLIISI